jgi:hypothetical protein
VVREREGIGLRPRCEGAEIITGSTEHGTDRAVAVVDAVDNGLGERHEPPHQVKGQVGARLTDALGDRCPREVKVAHEIATLLPIDERPVESIENTEMLGADGLREARFAT